MKNLSKILLFILPLLAGSLHAQEVTVSGVGTNVYDLLFGNDRTVTSTDPLVFNQTWNSGSDTFTAYRISVTDTASAAASLLFDAKVGGTSLMTIGKSGIVNTAVGFDGIGAIDLDYGSADITDHTFTSDGGTVILDGLVTVDVGLDGAGAVDLDYGSGDITDHTFTSDGGTVILDGSVTADGYFATADSGSTLGAAATTFAVTSGFAEMTGDGGGNTVATITGGVAGMPLTLLFTDANITITDTDAHTANTVDLSAAFTSADDTTLTLISDGTSWYEVSRSVN